MDCSTKEEVFRLKGPSSNIFIVKTLDLYLTKTPSDTFAFLISIQTFLHAFAFASSLGNFCRSSRFIFEVQFDANFQKCNIENGTNMSRWNVYILRPT
jgi:hypothetical protein